MCVYLYVCVYCAVVYREKTKINDPQTSAYSMYTIYSMNEVVVGMKGARSIECQLSLSSNGFEYIY